MFVERALSTRRLVIRGVLSGRVSYRVGKYPVVGVGDCLFRLLG